MPVMSPDGTQVVFHSLRTGNRDLFLIPSDGGLAVQLTDHPGQERNPRWTPDGLGIAFTADWTGPQQVFVVRRNDIGSPWGEPERVTGLEDESLWQARWSNSGSRLAISKPDAGLYVWSETGVWDTLDVTGLVVAVKGWSEDDSKIHFAALDDQGMMTMESFDLRTRQRRVLAELNDSRKSLWEADLWGDTLYLVLTEIDSDIYKLSVTIE